MDPERIRHNLRRRWWLVIPLTLVPLFLFRLVTGAALIPLPKTYESTVKLQELSPPPARPGSELPVDGIWAEIALRYPIWVDGMSAFNSERWDLPEDEMHALVVSGSRVRISEDGDYTFIYARASSPEEAQELAMALAESYSGWERLVLRQRAPERGLEIFVEREGVALELEKLREGLERFHYKADHDEFYAKVIGREEVTADELRADEELAQLHGKYRELAAEAAVKERRWEELSRTLGFRDLPPRVESVIEEPATLSELPVVPDARKIQNTAQAIGVTLGFGIWVILIFTGRAPEAGPKRKAAEKKRPRQEKPHDPGWVDY